MILLATILLRLGQPTGHGITPLHFGVNVEFFRSYLADGVTTKEAEFAAALRESGVRALRFPGGNPAYYYLPESRAQTLALAHAAGYWGFRDNLLHAHGFVTLERLASFARKYDFKLIYQLPCLFYLDGDTPRAIVRSTLSDRARNFDHNRVAQGVAYGMSIAERLHALGAPVALWELGNEEFAHCAAADYAQVVAAYVRALRQMDPERAITVVGMGKNWLPRLVPLLRKAGVLTGIHSFQVHYPFGNWPGPRKHGNRGDAARFALGDLKMERFLDIHFQGRRAAHVPQPTVSVTETMAMHHRFWDPSAVIATQGHALCYTWNWMTLLADRRVDCAVFHECGTTYFGMMRYDVGWKQRTHRFVLLGSVDDASLAPRFPGRYVVSPTGAANRLLSELVGEELVQVTPAPGRTFRALASRNRVVTVNRTAAPVVVETPFPLASAEAVTAESLSACLPGTFRRAPLGFQNKGARARVVLPEWSIAVLRMPDEK